MKYRYLLLTNLIFFGLLDTFAQTTNGTPISVSNIPSPEYGAGTSIGFSILGGGLVGLTARRALKNEDQIGLSMAYATIIELDGDEIVASYPGALLLGEYNFHLGNRYKEKRKKRRTKRKFKKNYISAKAGGGISEVNYFRFGLTWHKEMFFLENNKFSKGIDLGLSYIHLAEDDYVLLDNELRLFVRFDWNWFRGQ